MLGDLAVLTGGTADLQGPGHPARQRQADRPGPRQEVHASLPKKRPSSAARARRKRSTAAPNRSAKRSKRTDSEYDREKLQERLAKLAGGVAQINVRRRDRNRDEGAQVPARRRQERPPRRLSKRASSPAAAWRCSAAKRRSTSLKLEGDEKHGAAIVKNVLDYPLRCIADNAGVDGAVVVNRVRQLKGKNEGYDADRDEYTDLVAAGIIDPAKVVRIALQNAASVASLLLTTESLVTDIPNDEKEGGDHDHGHDHGMGGGMGGMGGMGAWAAWAAWVA